MVARHLLQTFAASLAVAGILSPALAQDQRARHPENGSSATETGPAAHDRYEVPDGDVETLLEFVRRLKSFRPKTNADFIERSKRLPGAMKKAAEKILEIERDTRSEAARTAAEILLNIRIEQLPEADPEDQRATYEEVKRFLTSIDMLAKNELGLALKAANALERVAQGQLAIEAYRTFGDLFARQEEELLARYGDMMLGIARRLDLLGSEMEITGTTLDGEPFDWENYRGKVVLVDFWATWCGPCVAELPNVKKCFDQYHEKGFDVVGISLDTNRARLEEFIRDRQLPWVTLFEERTGREHPLATFYGVMEIPTAMLVDQHGTVISMNARGRELGRQLESLLGPPSE